MKNRKITVVEKCGNHSTETKQRVLESVGEGGFTDGCAHGVCRVKPGLDKCAPWFVDENPDWVLMPQPKGA